MNFYLSEHLVDIPKIHKARFREAGIHIVNQITSYPKPYKYLQLVESDTQKSNPQIFEIFTNQKLLPLPDGGIEIDFTNGNQVRVDSRFGVPLSWGTVRYGHLFELSDPEL